MKKFLAILCVMSMIFVMGVPSFALSSTTHIESDEPNNTMSDAEGIYALETNEEDIIIYGVASQEDTEDWYKVRSYKDSNEGFVYIWEYDEIKYSIYLYDENGVFISKSHDWYKGQEISNVYIRNEEVYYIRVKYESGGYPKTPYKLTFSVDY